MKSITVQGFLLRLLFALLLVMLTYNPGGYSYSHRLQNSFSHFDLLLGLAGISLIIGWVVYLRATLRSLGLMGLILAVLFFSAIIWLLIDWGWLGLGNVTAMSWLIQLLISTVLVEGISCSHKITRQVDSVDIGEGSHDKSGAFAPLLKYYTFLIFSLFTLKNFLVLHYRLLLSLV